MLPSAEDYIFRDIIARRCQTTLCTYYNRGVYNPTDYIRRLSPTEICGALWNIQYDEVDPELLSN